MAYVIDKEYKIFQQLVTVPDEFEDGFGLKTIVAALFMGFLMVPASIYLGLFMGRSLDEAAKWVTVILFSEVAKRSMKSLRQQEIFVLFYMTGIVLSSPANLLWHQYFVRSPAAIAFGVAPLIPSWIAPQKAVLDQYGRTFLTLPWLKPILFMTGMHLISRIDRFGLGYALYRWTAHVEKLPFPMAPQGALGITALVETRDSAQRWRWRCFSLGAMLGMGWGVIYIGVPSLTGTLLRHPLFIVPEPWLDLTQVLSTQTQFPAVPFELTFELGGVLLGMFLPFWMIMGSMLGVVATIIVNPILYHSGMLTTWHPGMGVVDTKFSNHLDFYLSFSIGIAFSIFITSVLPALKPIFRNLLPARRTGGIGITRQALDDGSGEGRWTLRRLWHVLTHRNRQRGDISILISLAIYVLSTLGYIGISLWLMPGTAAAGYRDRFPWIFFLIFGFIYQPSISYVHAKLTGMMGMSVTLPLVREASFILSGYKGAAIWFAPIPISDYGGAATEFRVLELTGTKLISIIKTDILAFPILILTTVLFSDLIWRMAPIPSEAYPVTQQLWNQRALHDSLTYSATLGVSSPFIEAIKVNVIGSGLGIGLIGYAIVRFLSLPILIFYGLVLGLNAGPGGVVAMTIGALVGKFYFQRKYDPLIFKRYIMIVFAGFSAGMGLIGMAAVAFALISKSTNNLGF